MKKDRKKEQHLLCLLAGLLLWKLCTSAYGALEGLKAVDPAPQVALTFDDGPHPAYTEILLDGLKERGVTATFFVLGEKVEGQEKLLKRMAAEGHLIGNHTYSHRRLDTMSLSQAEAEIRAASCQVEKAIGKGTEFIRPPFGVWSRETEYKVLMLPVLWTVDTLDWTTKNVPLIVERATKKTKDQDIILFHDCYESSVQAALQTVDILKEKGYQFVTVDKIILG